jgi:hypothetical protein
MDLYNGVRSRGKKYLSLKTTIKASDAKQQQIYSPLWCSEGFVNKTDEDSDDSPLEEVSHSLSQSEFQPDVTGGRCGRIAIR